MDSEKAFGFIIEVIREQLYHQDYQRVVDVRKWCHAINSGEGQDEMIVKYKERETDEQKEQRVHITNSLTPFASGKVRNVFSKTDRVDNVQKQYGHKESRADLTVKMKVDFFHAMADLEKYINDNARDFTFYDPNSVLLLDFDSVSDGEVITDRIIYPTIIDSPNILFFPFDKVGQREFLMFFDEKKILVNEKESVVKDYWFYGKGFGWRFERLADDRVAENELVVITDKDGNDMRFDAYYFENGTAEVPAMAFGYMKDPLTKGRTFVSPLFPGEKVFNDLINLKSEFDLTKALHTFLQKIGYAPECEVCYGEGYVHTEDGKQKCHECNGSGLNVHKTSQDAIWIKMPNAKDDFVSLRDFITYVDLPEWLPKWQDEHIDKIISRISISIFNTDVFTRSEVAVTATEKALEMDALNDTLIPFVEFKARLFKRCVRIIAQYMEIPSDGLINVYAYPKDLKMKTATDLTNELKLAKDAGAGYDVLWGIEQDILEKMNQDNPEVIQRARVQNYFNPFTGKTVEEISIILTERDRLDNDRVLWENSHKIFSMIEEEYGQDFYAFNRTAQRDIIQVKVDQVKQEIAFKSTEPVIPDFGNLGE